MDIKERIKEAAYASGMDMCGVSGIDRFKEALPGKHPCDILPGCKSVIVIGIGLLDGALQSNFRAFEDGRHDLKGIYGTYAYTIFPNFHLAHSCYVVARFIEKELKSIATPCSTGPLTNGMQISIKHAAVAAGLAEFGWSGIVLSPEFGPRNRFGVILTTAELEPDPIYNGKRLCNPEKCGICTKVCPSQALSLYGGTDEISVVNMDGHRYEYRKFDMAKCYSTCVAMRKEYGGADDYLTAENPTMDDFWEAAGRMPFDDGLQNHATWHCGKCQAYCPAGNWAEHFKKTGLSRGADMSMG